MKIKGEKGQALPLVMIAVVVGALIIPPFLGHTGSSLIGSRTFTQAIHAQYACDSGAEHAIWNLTEGGIISSLATAGSMVSYTLPESINGLTTTVKISNSYETIAWDNFESAGWTGGGGWTDNWTHTGESLVTTSGTAYEGSYHLRLRSSTGYVKRSVDLSHEVSARLRFWAKASGFEAGETAICQVSSNGVNWTTVYTCVDGMDDNVYRFYDIDLTPYTLSGRFWIAFDANMSGTGDYFYVDKLEIIWLAAAVQTVAWDNFNSGGWTGGGGWLGNWTHTGTSSVTTAGTPYEGSHHLLLQSSDGYVKRPVDLSNEVIARLRFWAKASSFEVGETATCRVSSDNISWTTVHTWVNGDDDNVYHYYDINLSDYNLTSAFWIAFDANMSNTGDYLYVDNLSIISMNGFGITSRAGDRTVKAVVDLGGGTVTVLAWYIK